MHREWMATFSGWGGVGPALVQRRVAHGHPATTGIRRPDALRDVATTVIERVRGSALATKQVGLAPPVGGT